MENPEEVLTFLEEFTKLNSNNIPRELEEYLLFVAKTGDPVYQWSAIKTLFRQKLLNVITEFYETCPSVEIPPCPNVDLFNYERMKNFILEKLDTFAAAPFTVQRICELLTTPRKEYNRIDKYMRALEKNILVVSTREPGTRRATENAEGIVNGLETEHTTPETTNPEINVEVDMEESPTPAWPKTDTSIIFHNAQANIIVEPQSSSMVEPLQQSPFATELKPEVLVGGDSVITCQKPEEPYVSIEPVTVLPSSQNTNPAPIRESEIIVTITADPIVKVKPPEIDVPVSIAGPIAIETTLTAVISPSVTVESEHQEQDISDSITALPLQEETLTVPETPLANNVDESIITTEAVQELEPSKAPISSEAEEAVNPIWVSDVKPQQQETLDVEPETSDMKVTETPNDVEAETSDMEEPMVAVVSALDEIAAEVDTTPVSTSDVVLETEVPISLEKETKENDITANVPLENVNEGQTEITLENEVQTDYPIADIEDKVEAPVVEAPTAMEVDEILPDAPVASSPAVAASE